MLSELLSSIIADKNMIKIVRTQLHYVNREIHSKDILPHRGLQNPSRFLLCFKRAVISDKLPKNGTAK